MPSGSVTVPPFIPGKPMYMLSVKSEKGLVLTQTVRLLLTSGCIRPVRDPWDRTHNAGSKGTCPRAFLGSPQPHRSCPSLTIPSEQLEVGLVGSEQLCPGR